MDARRRMDKALKDVVIAHLRRQGFKGSFPHFRRHRDKQIDLLSFQFNKYGGSFAVEIATAPPEGVTTSWGKHIAPEQVNVTWINQRLRLGSLPDKGVNDHWFSFAPPSHEPQPETLLDEHFESVAREVVEAIDAQAESWWRAC